MAIQPTGRAPYTTAAAFTTVLDAWRERGLGVPVTPDVLARAGVPESLARRTLQSLVDLELLSEKGEPSEQFESFRSIRGEDEYRGRLQEWLRSAYADVLIYTDPSTASFDSVAEAFRTYQPTGQRRGMASLLLGLWRYAGLPVASDSADALPPRLRPPRASRAAAPAKKAMSTRKPASGAVPSDLPPGLVGLLQQIPRNGRGWTKDTRNSFVAAFSAVLDFTVPVVAEDLPDEEELEEDSS